MSGHCCPTHTHTHIGACMMYHVELNCSQSPAGRAPTLLIRIVGARPAGDCARRQKYRNIAPTLKPTARKLIGVEHSCQICISTDTNKRYPRFHGLIRFRITETLMKTNSSDTATESVFSCKKGYLRRNGASPNPKNAPTSAPTIPTIMLVMLNILSNLKRPGSIPATIPVPSIKKSIMHPPCYLKLVHGLAMAENWEELRDKISSIHGASCIASKGSKKILRSCRGFIGVVIINRLEDQKSSMGRKRSLGNLRTRP